MIKAVSKEENELYYASCDIANSFLLIFDDLQSANVIKNTEPFIFIDDRSIFGFTTIIIKAKAENEFIIQAIGVFGHFTAYNIQLLLTILKSVVERNTKQVWKVERVFIEPDHNILFS